MDVNEAKARWDSLRPELLRLKFEFEKQCEIDWLKDQIIQVESRKLHPTE